MNSPPSQLSIVRVGLLAGVLMFGGVTWVLHQQGSLTMAPPDTAAVLTTIAMVITAVSLLAVLVIRVFLVPGVPKGQHGSITIIAWAIGETPALFGAVHYFMTGEPRWFIVGLTVMLVAFFAMPVPKRA